MGQAALTLPMSAEEFLVWEASQPTKHEFVQGDVFAMAGAGEAHVTVAGNLYTALRSRLKGTPCRTYIADMKLRVEAADAFFYPDVMVTCSEADTADPLVKREPVLLVEVLSASTAVYDRSGKFASYRHLRSLREYVLVDTVDRRCDVYRLRDGGLWVLHPFDAGHGLTLTSVGAEIPAEAVWDEVPLEPASSRARFGRAP